ncbi:T9SS type A sorting domain-containing protein [Pontibacter chitinilyticus]|uniref:T9SS type A sorting domain-containing protein n=1 Tax=Pontibacter chitinilyticus TaxID=2674989 RepID=UPI003219FB10
MLFKNERYLAQVTASIIFTIVALATTPFKAHGQSPRSVSAIITDYNGFWQSSASAISTTKPDNSHNLLSFTYQGTRYSTGVDDDNLTSHGLAFTKGLYKSLPQFNVTGTITSNTKVALGERYDSVTNGKSTPSPDRNINLYLVDGKQGLDLGTGVANLPAGSLTFDMTNILADAVGDGVPDILVTQIADPAQSSDTYAFLDESGKQVGNSVSITFYNIIAPVGNWVADFYEASQSPMTLGSTFTKTERPLRLWAGDFSDFGLTPTDVARIRKFKITLSGNSDVAFVAYNANAFLNKTAVMPVTLLSFKAKQNRGEVVLNWATASEEHSSHFDVEVSRDGKAFGSIGTVAAAGNSNTRLNYTYKYVPPAAGTYYFRLKQVDVDGTFEYSKVVVAPVLTNQQVYLYPNPAGGEVMQLRHPVAAGAEKVTLWNAAGKKLLEQPVAKGSTETSLNVEGFPAGVYQVSWQTATGKTTLKLLLK